MLFRSEPNESQTPSFVFLIVSPVLGFVRFHVSRSSSFLTLKRRVWNPSSPTNRVSSSVCLFLFSFRAFGKIRSWGVSGADSGSQCWNTVFGSGFGGIGVVSLCKARVLVGWVWWVVCSCGFFAGRILLEAGFSGSELI